MTARRKTKPLPTKLERQLKIALGDIGEGRAGNAGA